MQVEEIALTSVLVVEDDPAMQARTQRLLREVAGNDTRMDVAPDLTTARRLSAAHAYTLALVDVQLPDGNGIDFIGWLRTHAPQVPAVVVSSWAEEDTIVSALRNGAIGYLLKNAEDIELTMALRSLQRGGAPIDPMIARRILQLMVPAAKPAADLNVDPGAHLSTRESEILQLVSRGLSNREIAEATGLSKLTIECHTRNIYRKLEVGSRTAAVFEAQARGLLQ